MSKILLFLLHALLCATISAQTNSILETAGIGAVQQLTHLDDDRRPDYFVNLYCSFSGDTSVSNNIFHKYYCRQFKFKEDQGVFYFGAFRAEGKKLYFLQRDSSKEHLLFDYALSIGEKTPSGLYVVGIDSAVLNDGIRRRYLRTAAFPPPWNEGFKMYEGIGAFQSFLAPLYLAGGYDSNVAPTTQLCKNGVGLFTAVDFYWPFPQNLICDYFVNTEEFDVGDEGFQIRPSLIQDYFSLWCPSAMHGQPLRIRMYASDGKVLQTLEVQALEKIDLDVGNLPNGPFFVQVWAGNKTFSKIAFKY